MIIDVTTKSGAIYRIDFDRGFWHKRREYDEGIFYEVHMEKIWFLKVGTNLTTPWQDEYSWASAERPEVGKHMYISSRDVWYVSTLVADISEVPNWNYGRDQDYLDALDREFDDNF